MAEAQKVVVYIAAHRSEQGGWKAIVAGVAFWRPTIGELGAAIMEHQLQRAQVPQ